VSASLLEIPDCRAASDALLQHKQELCERTVALHWDRVPELASRYSKRGRDYCLQDCAFHIDYLAQAVATNQPSLFIDYVGWARSMLAAYKVPANDLIVNLECLGTAAQTLLKPALHKCIDAAMEPALGVLRAELAADDSHLFESSPYAELASGYLKALLAGRRAEASALIMKAADTSVPVRDIYLHVFQPAQREIGRLWQLNQVGVAQEHYCTAATQLIMAQLYPRIFSTPRNGRTVVTACVSGELHELGARMVSDFFEMDGWDSFYLGANTPAASIVSLLGERSADVLALSTTITSHIGQVVDIISRVRASSVGRIKILVGGYPFNIAPDLYKTVGADAWAKDADGAIRRANELVADA
jgi:methanogenic corrinoid protein MtbC1